MAQIGTDVALTTTDAVRGALGVDATDIPDQTILNAALDAELGLDLTTWLSNWKTKIAPAAPATEDQVNLATAIKAYCKWWCATEFARKYLTFLQLYGDGKAQMRRFTNFDWDQLVANAQSKVDTFKALVRELDPETDASAVSNSYALISGGIPTHDPVTNEGAR